MTNYQHLLVGGGMTPAAPVDDIREVDSKGGIGLISVETDAGPDIRLETEVLSIVATRRPDVQTDAKDA